jgi:2-C-methyl-D-erythritol 4-phosphate cytidylyltransferase
MRNIAVILAGGIGSRVGGETPKQLLPLADGRSILEHSIDAFEASPSIDEIAVVMHPDHISSLQKLCQSNHWQKLTKIIPGGAERWESSYNAIKAFIPSLTLSPPLHGEVGWGILLHDAARPFVSQRIIADVCQALETHEAVTVAVPVTDTIYEVRNNEVQEVKNRRDFMRAQTPQAFHLHLIAEAFEDAIKKGYITSVTDDVAVLKAFNPSIPVFIVPGEESNKKITYPEDIK